MGLEKLPNKIWSLPPSPCLIEAIEHPKAVEAARQRLLRRPSRPSGRIRTAGPDWRRQPLSEGPRGRNRGSALGLSSWGSEHGFTGFFVRRWHSARYL